MTQEHAIHVPCIQCGAPLLLDMHRGAAQCLHCDLEQPISAEILVRARAHLDALFELEQQGGAALGEAAYYQRMGRSWISFLGVIFLNLSMVGGGWLWFFLRETLTKVTGPILSNLIMIPLAVAGLIAVVAGWSVFLTYRKRIPATLAPVEVGAVVCDNCGASVPVAVGRELRCPFCEAVLVSGESATKWAEAAAQQQVQQMEQQAAIARDVYQQKMIQQTHAGNRFARIWMGICFGTFAGMPFMFLLEHLGIPDFLLFLGLLPGIGLGIGIAVWINRRRAP